MTIAWSSICRTYFCLLLLTLTLAGGTSSHAGPGKFVNPITDVCWECLFPITIGGFRVSPSGEDTDNPRTPLCACATPFPRVGMPISFWEPVRLVDVTRIPYNLVNMGGLQIMDTGVKGAGNVSTSRNGKTRESFYQVHWYAYPLLYWLELLVDFVCMEKGAFDLAYLTELDPLWNDDEMSFIINPEAALFANPIAQAACAADCVKASVGFSFDSLFWCGGCQGTLYPFTGNVNYHIGGVQASLLIVQRFIAKLHRQGLLWGTVGKDAYCGEHRYPMPVIKKSQYKTQMTYPIPNTDGCQPLGRTEIIWGAGREFPKDGEDFGYLIWRKRTCCLL
ncbi:MAG: TraU family protein [Flavobacteriales bacterium]|nr:TraU family protein [Flavobacteriales bacterium]